MFFMAIPRLRCARPPISLASPGFGTFIEAPRVPRLRSRPVSSGSQSEDCRLAGRGASAVSMPSPCRSGIAGTGLRAESQPPTPIAEYLCIFFQQQLKICLANGQVRTRFLLELALGFEAVGLDSGDAVGLAHQVARTMALDVPLQVIENRLQDLFEHIIVLRDSKTSLRMAVDMAMTARATRLFSELGNRLAPLRARSILDLSPGDTSLAHLLHTHVSSQLSCAEMGSFPMPEDAKISAAPDRRLPFSDASHDVVMIVDGLRHAEHRQQCLREIARILKPGGTLFLLEKTACGGDVFDVVNARRAIFLADFFLRNLLPERARMPLPGSAATQAEWTSQFLQAGYAIETARPMGADRPFSHFRHTLFILRAA